MSDDLNEIILEANQRGYQRAFETAVRTGTALVFSRNGKIVEVTPPIDMSLCRSSQLKRNDSLLVLKRNE